MSARGAIPSPNIWANPQTYELENLAVDPDGALDAAMAELVADSRAGLLAGTWGHVLDVGCGNGFHLPRLAAVADRVTGVEPYPALVRAAADRVRGLAKVTVRQGSAQELPLPDASVDIAHARWAYFFGPGCEPGLVELARVCRRGALAVIADHDATRSSVGRWFAEGLQIDGIAYDPDAVERFWGRQGFTRRRVDVRWSFRSTADLAAVLRIEFPVLVADRALAELGDSLTVDAAVNLWHRRY